MNAANHHPHTHPHNPNPIPIPIPITPNTTHITTHNPPPSLLDPPKLPIASPTLRPLHPSLRPIEIAAVAVAAAADVSFANHQSINQSLGVWQQIVLPARSLCLCLCRSRFHLSLVINCCVAYLRCMRCSLCSESLFCQPIVFFVERTHTFALVRPISPLVCFPLCCCCFGLVISLLIFLSVCLCLLYLCSWRVMLVMYSLSLLTPPNLFFRFCCCLHFVSFFLF